MKQYEITVNGKVYQVSVEELEGNNPAAASENTRQTVKSESTPAPSQTAPGENGTTITAPMPGTILRVSVTEGQKVQRGDVLCVLEAMKMENEIVAPSNGTISSINISSNQAVDSGNLLMIIS